MYETDGKWYEKNFYHGQADPFIYLAVYYEWFHSLEGVETRYDTWPNQTLIHLIRTACFKDSVFFMNTEHPPRRVIVPYVRVECFIEGILKE